MINSTKTKQVIVNYEETKLDYEKKLKDIELLFAQWDKQSKEFEELGEQFFQRLRQDSSNLIIPIEALETTVLKSTTNKKCMNRSSRKTTFEYSNDEDKPGRCFERSVQNKTIDNIIENLTSSAQKRNSKEFTSPVAAKKVLDEAAQTSFNYTDDASYTVYSMRQDADADGFDLTKSGLQNFNFLKSSTPYPVVLNNISIQTSLPYESYSAASSSCSTHDSSVSNLCDDLNDEEQNDDRPTTTASSSIHETNSEMSDILSTPAAAAAVNPVNEIFVADAEELKVAVITPSSLNSTEGGSDFVNPSDTCVDSVILKKTHARFQDLEMDFLNPNDTNQLSVTKVRSLRNHALFRTDTKKNIRIIKSSLNTDGIDHDEVFSISDIPPVGTDAIDDVRETSSMSAAKTNPTNDKLDTDTKEITSKSIDFQIVATEAISYVDKELPADEKSIQSIPADESKIKQLENLDVGCDTELEADAGPVSEDVNLTECKRTQNIAVKSKRKPRKAKRKAICMPKAFNERKKFYADSKYNFVTYKINRDAIKTPQGKARKVYQIKRSVMLQKDNMERHYTPLAELSPSQDSNDKSKRFSVEMSHEALSEKIEATQCEGGSNEFAPRGGGSDSIADECAECTAELSKRNESGTPLNELLCKNCVCRLQERGKTPTKWNKTLRSKGLQVSKNFKSSVTERLHERNEETQTKEKSTVNKTNATKRSLRGRSKRTRVATCDSEASESVATKRTLRSRTRKLYLEFENKVDSNMEAKNEVKNEAKNKTYLLPVILEQPQKNCDVITFAPDENVESKNNRSRKRAAEKVAGVGRMNLRSRGIDRQQCSADVSKVILEKHRRRSEVKKPLKQRVRKKPRASLLPNRRKTFRKTRSATANRNSSINSVIANQNVLQNNDDGQKEGVDKKKVVEPEITNDAIGRRTRARACKNQMSEGGLVQNGDDSLKNSLHSSTSKDESHSSKQHQKKKKNTWKRGRKTPHTTERKDERSAQMIKNDERSAQVIKNAEKQKNDRDFNNESQNKQENSTTDDVLVYGTDNSDIDETDNLKTYIETVIEQKENMEPSEPKKRKSSHDTIMSEHQMESDHEAMKDISVRPVPPLPSIEQKENLSKKLPIQEVPHTKINTVNLSRLSSVSSYKPVNASRNFGESTVSYLGRKKKFLFNNKANTMTTPGRNGKPPLNSTVIDDSKRNVGRKSFVNISKIGQSVMSELSVIGHPNVTRNNATNMTSNISNVTYGMPGRLSKFLKSFEPTKLRKYPNK